MVKVAGFDIGFKGKTVLQKLVNGRWVRLEDRERTTPKPKPKRKVRYFWHHLKSPSATKSGPGRRAKHGEPRPGHRLAASYAKRYATV